MQSKTFFFPPHRFGLQLHGQNHETHHGTGKLCRSRDLRPWRWVKTETSGEWISYISIISSSMPRNRSFFFGEGTVLRQFNTTTGALKIGTHLGPSEPGQVYFGGTNF